MANDDEKFDKQQRAERLKQAREAANLKGAKAVVDASNGSININNYKGHESGRNGFSIEQGRRYADLFGVPLTWLYLGIGDPKDFELPGASVELRRAFTKLVDSPQEIQNLAIGFIDFHAGNSAQSRPDQSRDQSVPASRPHGSEPSRSKSVQRTS